MPSISVKDEEIFIAKRGVTTRCAIAAAIMSQVPAARHIKVTPETISYLDVNRQERVVYQTPLKAAEFSGMYVAATRWLDGGDRGVFVVNQYELGRGLFGSAGEGIG